MIGRLVLSWLSRLSNLLFLRLRLFLIPIRDPGLGALLSQRRSPDGPLLPSGFYAKKLSPTKCNYNIGDRELLAIILALKEAQHLLEGSVVLVLDLTDQKNPMYLSEARRLTPHQAKWALFLSRYNYVA